MVCYRAMPPLYHVDAFADRPFAGNPAAVVVLEGGEADHAWMQRVAAEMNLSETAFVQAGAAPEAAGAFGLRWFTPAAEVELCGHATLAAAHVLWETGRAARDSPIEFQTRFRGALKCAREGDHGLSGQEGAGASPLIRMVFPADVPVDVAAPPALLEVLRLPAGAGPVHVARGRYDWIVELADAEHVRRYTPDFAALARIDCRGIALTARGVSASASASVGGRPDVVSRFFAPRLRIDEDSVTGSLHCALGPYWSRRLGKRALHCHQASARGGDVYVTMLEDGVELAGRAVTVAQGELVADQKIAKESRKSGRDRLGL